jgi:hypothetical protein
MDDDLNVKRFASRAVVTTRDLAEGWDASLDDVLEAG